METPLLVVEDLQVAFPSRRGRVQAVDGLSFTLNANERVAIVGESGSGKSVTALALMRLLDPHASVVSATRLSLEGEELLQLPERAMRRIRGARISMIFQEPMTSLNPVLTIGEQIAEPLREHRGLSPKAARAEAIELLRAVRLPDPHLRVDEFPHRLSGGQRQRVVIAIAIACKPRLLIADEPTTALDVTVQAQILDLLLDLQAQYGNSILLISHDLRLVSSFADRVLVMYAGRQVEEGPAAQVIAAPRHPYSMGLLAATPVDMRNPDGTRRRLREIEGGLPDPTIEIPGCNFAARCAYRLDACADDRPPAIAVAPDRVAVCRRAAEALG